jgi:hypothetical protein
MYEPDDDEAIERMALEDLSRRARGSRFASRMPEDQRAAVELGAAHSGGGEPGEPEATGPAGQDFRQANSNMGKMIRRYDIDEDKLNY